MSNTFGIPVQLFGYQNLVESAVYAKDTTVKGVDETLVPVQRIAVLARYTSPSEDQIVAYLQEKAREVAPAMSLVLPKGQQRVGKSNLETLLMNLPLQVINDLRSGDESCLNFARRNTPAPKLAEGEEAPAYVQVQFGLLTPETVTAHLEEGKNNDVQWYEKALTYSPFLERGLGMKWYARVLIENNALPLYKEMSVLLKHKTHLSQSLVVEGNAVYQDVEEVVTAFYNDSGLASPHHIARLRDISAEKRELWAVKPVLAFHENFREMVLQANVREQMAGQKGLILPGRFPPKREKLS